jgi:hypothetical protein
MIGLIYFHAAATFGRMAAASQLENKQSIDNYEIMNKNKNFVLTSLPKSHTTTAQFQKRKKMVSLVT